VKKVEKLSLPLCVVKALRIYIGRLKMTHIGSNCNYYKTLANGYQQKYMGKKNGKEIWKYVHRLKVGAKDGEIVHHKNGNKADQSADNLSRVSSRGRHNTIDEALHNGGRGKGK
jgi:hypothetical protein